jgi:hypothetical protein
LESARVAVFRHTLRFRGDHTCNVFHCDR